MQFDLVAGEMEIRQLAEWHRQQMATLQKEAVEHQKRAEELLKKIAFTTLTVAECGSTYKA